ncbi:hypothetical protein BDV12DRAFT_185606 [Aspergillus spectabilis]
MAPSATFINIEPPTVIGPATKKATRPSNALPQSLIQKAKVAKREVFNAASHLNFQLPKSIYTMEQMGLKGQGSSRNAASKPFPLFTGYLSPTIDFEIANINISIRNEDMHTEQTINLVSDEDLPAVVWHYDSFPFVCVTMLSDCTDMVGGETALRTPNGEILKVRGPVQGAAVVLQGRYIDHQALKAHGGRERISMVTCFRPTSPLVKDETVLVGVRGISDLSEL